jgi:1,4-dihydroxy-2-naphthoate octaprenyltransferase
MISPRNVYIIFLDHASSSYGEERKQMVKLRAWLALSRPPFHSVGILPFILGGIIAWREKQLFRWDVFALGTLGVVLVMLTTYYAGEYWDYTEDTLASRLGDSRFSGGSKVLQQGLLPRQAALWASLTSFTLAIMIGAILQFAYNTGALTLPLGILGLFTGFFYSAKPVRWVSRGIGEIWIGFCYGWLPIAVSYYLQTGTITPITFWPALPIGFTIFNVVLLNEFPDYPADAQAKKNNLVVRLGQRNASILYCLVNVASMIAVPISLFAGIPASVLWFYAPVLMLSLVLVSLMMKERWKNRATLEKLCAANLLVNLGTTTAYILVFMS